MTCGLPDGGCFSLSALASIRLSASSIRSPLSREAASAAGAGFLTAAGLTRLVNLLLLISVLSYRAQHPNTPTPDFRTEFSAFTFQVLGCWSVGVSIAPARKNDAFRQRPALPSTSCRRHRRSAHRAAQTAARSRRNRSRCSSGATPQYG